MTMERRTFAISEVLLFELDDISKYFNIKKTTIVRMAVCHGIERLRTKTVYNEAKNKYETATGYLPVRDHRKRVKRKYEIVLPEETWKELKDVMEDVEYKLEEHIPVGELIERFISIELRKFKNIYDEYTSAEDIENISKYTTLCNEVKVPNLLYRTVEQNKQKTEIEDTELEKYLLVCGAIQEHTYQTFDTIDTDVDLLNEIDKLGLNRLKALTLIRYLLACNLITWKL